MAVQVSCAVERTFWSMTLLDRSDALASLTSFPSPGPDSRDRCHSDSALKWCHQLWNDTEERECKATDSGSCANTDIDGSASSFSESDSSAEECDAECSLSPVEAVLSWSSWSAEMEDEGLGQAEADRAPRQASSLVAQLRQKLKKPVASTCRPVNHDEALNTPKTTLIFRNMPKSVTRSDLLDMLNSEGFSLDYSLVYLPLDFHSAKPLGYGLVDFVSEAAGERALLHFQGFNAWAAKSKACEVAWSQNNQGFESNVERYRNSALMHSSVPDEFKPAIFSRGQREPFPAPTRPVKVPRKGLAPASS